VVAAALFGGGGRCVYHGDPAMTQAARKTAQVIPLRPRAVKPGTGPAAGHAAPPAARRPAARNLLLFLVCSAALHGAAILLAPTVRFEQRSETPEILTVRLSEVPQIAERMAEPQPASPSEEPKPALPPPPPLKRIPPKAVATQKEAIPRPAALPVEQTSAPPESLAPSAAADATEKPVVQEGAQIAKPAPALTPPVFSAAYLKNPPPDYPAVARRRGQEGLVLLAVLVNESGAPAEVRVAESSGSSVLDDAALDAVRRWSFVPARRGDLAIAAWVEVPVRFRLKDR
jgi:protein TonB